MASCDRVYTEGLPGPGELLADLAGRGAQFRVEGGRLLVKPPPGGLSEAEAAGLREHKLAALAWLQRADAALAEVLGLLERVRKESPPFSAPDWVALEFKRVVQGYRDTCDSLVMEAPAAVRGWLARSGKSREWR